MTLEIISLRDDAHGSRASILSGLGFNCFEFVAAVDGREVDVIWSDPNFALGSERPSGSGIPLLFPFPGRLRGQTFRWQGREYQLSEGDGRGNAIHGFVLNRPWRVIEQTQRRVVGQFQASIDDPRILQQWPTDFRITATYELIGNRLLSSFHIENPDDHPLPCGLGTHPYFRLPLGGTAADACLVRLPVAKQWELVDMLPTGICQQLANADEYQRGLRFGDMKLDNVFAGLMFADDQCAVQISDPDSGMELEMKFDRAFRECVVYTPPHRSAICVEPYTCVPGSLGLDDSATDFGWRLLPPGESFTARVELAVA